MCLPLTDYGCLSNGPSGLAGAVWHLPSKAVCITGESHPLWEQCKQHIATKLRLHFLYILVLNLHVISACHFCTSVVFFNSCANRYCHCSGWFWGSSKESKDLRMLQSFFQSECNLFLYLAAWSWLCVNDCLLLWGSQSCFLSLPCSLVLSCLSIVVSLSHPEITTVSAFTLPLCFCEEQLWFWYNAVLLYFFFL